MQNNNTTPFRYEEAFSRNIGWVTEQEQLSLRGKKVAIAGLGGVGGSHLLTLARLGIGRFAIADFDRFDIPNFNRQAGAGISTVGEEKISALRRMALDINPELCIDEFPEGISKHNIDEFLRDVDIYVDSLDFFAFDARSLVFKRCRQLGITAVTAAPLGMGVAFLAFTPQSISFEEYFRFKGQQAQEKSLRFALGLAPARLQMQYLVDASRVRLDRQEGPSTGIACQLCAGFAGAQVLKILLARGRITAAPWSLHFDAYTMQLKKNWLPLGNRNPWQRVRLAAARHLLQHAQKRASTAKASE